MIYIIKKLILLIEFLSAGGKFYPNFNFFSGGLTLLWQGQRGERDQKFRGDLISIPDPHDNNHLCFSAGRH